MGRWLNTGLDLLVIFTVDFCAKDFDNREDNLKKSVMETRTPPGQKIIQKNYQDI
jgi:hypothetical protein